MALFNVSENWEGQSPGTTITTGNSIFTQGVWGSGTRTFSSSSVAQNMGQSAQFSISNGNHVSYVQRQVYNGSVGSYVLYFRLYVQLSGWPNGGNDNIHVFSACRWQEDKDMSISIDGLGHVLVWLEGDQKGHSSESISPTGSARIEGKLDWNSDRLEVRMFTGSNIHGANPNQTLGPVNISSYNRWKITDIKTGIVKNPDRDNSFSIRQDGHAFTDYSWLGPAFTSPVFSGPALSQSIGTATGTANGRAIGQGHFRLAAGDPIVVVQGNKLVPFGTAHYGATFNGTASGEGSSVRELHYRLGDVDGIEWGGRVTAEDTNPYLVQETILESVGIRAQDHEPAHSDGIEFGVDSLEGQTISWSLIVRGDTPNDTMDNWGRLQAAWIGESVRHTSNKLLPLYMRYKARRESRMVYGRPRNLSPTMGTVFQRIIPVEMSFDCVDPYFYDEDPQTIYVRPIVGSGSPGLTTPLMSPLTSGSLSEGYTNLVIAGTVPAWFRARFHGPVVNPYLRIPGFFTLSLNGTIVGGDYVDVDSRPWSRGVVHKDGSNWGGKLSPLAPPMRHLKLTPGDYTAVYDGVDATRTSYVEINYQAAYTSL